MATIVERNGPYLVRVRKHGVTKSKTFPTKTAAKSWASQIEREIERAGYTGTVSVRGATVADMIDKYFAEVAPKKAPGRTKRHNLQKIRDEIGHVALANLNTKRVLDYAEVRMKAGSGPATVKDYLTYLGSVLTVARAVWLWDIDERIVPDALAALKYQGMVRNSIRRDRRLRAGEEEKLLGYFENRRASHWLIPMDAIVPFLIDTAMRCGEMTRLKWSDLNEEDMTILIRDRKHPTEKLGNDMEVPLLGRSFDLLMSQPRTSDRVFPYDVNSIGQAFKRACIDLGIEDLRIHDLRHEGVTRLFEAGYRIEQVRLVSGHRNMQTLMRYTQIRAKDLHRIAAQ